MHRQKFIPGDHVKVVDSPDCPRSYLGKGREAIVTEYSEGDYCLYIKGWGDSAWYGEEQLTLITEDRRDLLKQWRKEEVN